MPDAAIFSRPLPGARFVEVRTADSLLTIAMRELGDAGGPLVAGAVATASVVAAGLGAVAALTAGAAALALIGLRRPAARD